jgi:hypothetical protein
MRALLVSVLLAATSAFATQVVDPPINNETIIGVWEALWCENPATLWRMEINKTGKSYLAQITVGAACIVRPLVSSEIADGKVKLHFAAVQGTGNLHGVDFADIWIIGSGEGTATRGGIDAGNWHFVKGSWTRDVAQASKTAEESIKQAASQK